MSGPESLASNIDMFLAEYLCNPKVYEPDIEFRKVRAISLGLLTEGDQHDIAGFNVPVDCVFVGILQCIKKLASYMKDLTNLNFLFRDLTGVDDVSEVQLAPYQLHTYENILAEGIGIDSLLYAVCLYDMAVCETSGYHCSLFEAVNS